MEGNSISLGYVCSPSKGMLQLKGCTSSTDLIMGTACFHPLTYPACTDSLPSIAPYVTLVPLM